MSASSYPALPVTLELKRRQGGPLEEEGEGLCEEMQSTDKIILIASYRAGWAWFFKNQTLNGVDN